MRTGCGWQSKQEGAWRGHEEAVLLLILHGAVVSPRAVRRVVVMHTHTVTATANDQGKNAWINIRGWRCLHEMMIRNSWSRSRMEGIGVHDSSMVVGLDGILMIGMRGWKRRWKNRGSMITKVPGVFRVIHRVVLIRVRWLNNGKFFLHHGRDGSIAVVFGRNGRRGHLFLGRRWCLVVTVAFTA